MKEILVQAIEQARCETGNDEFVAYRAFKIICDDSSLGEEYKTVYVLYLIHQIVAQTKEAQNDG